MSGSQHRKDEKTSKKGGAKPPRVGSSLTDAVTAALASVDAPAGKTPNEGKAADAGENGAAAEAGCAATQGAPSDAAASPTSSGAPPPAAVVQPEPAKIDPPKANGSGFRGGPGSFSDLLRRWEAGVTAPVVAESAAADPEPAAGPSTAGPSTAGPSTDGPSTAGPSTAEPSSAPEPSSADELTEAAGEADAAPEPAVVPAKDPVRVTYYGRTDVGLVREHNEDNYTVADLAAGLRDGKEPREAIASDRGVILAVCDGMGGAAAGEVASQMAVDTIYEIMNEGEPTTDRDHFARRLVRSIEEAGHRIFSAAKMDRSRRGMGTTATLAGFIDNMLFVGQVGDSRAYVLRGKQFEQVTKDQSLVNQLIEAGQLTEEEAEAFEHSNIILQALGTTEDVTVDLTFLEMRRGDRLLMCSDGLSGLVHAEMMKEVLQDTKELPEAAAKLIQMANAGGGHDNITVILADFDGEGLAEVEGAKVVYQQYPLPPDESRERSMPPRETSMKAGGAKPGADVKRGDDYASAHAPEGEPGSKTWMLVLAAVALLVLVAGGYYVFGMGGASGAADPRPVGTTPVAPVDPVVEPDIEEDFEEGLEEGLEADVEPDVAPAVVEQGTIQVLTDVEDGTLFVNGQRHSALSDGMTLTLDPGAYTFEARSGETSIASQIVTLEAGATLTLELSVPEGQDERPGTEPPTEEEPEQTTRPRTGRRSRPPTPRRPPTGPTVRPLGGGGGGSSFGGGGGGGGGGTTAPPSNPF